jgi:hypothetical protein
MLIKFKSRTSADFIMFAESAVTLIKMMGHTGTIPGAMSAAEVPEALARLKQALSGQRAAPSKGAEDEDADESAADFPVDLAKRAVPLIDMLTAAAAADSYVMWEKG